MPSLRSLSGGIMAQSTLTEMKHVYGTAPQKTQKRRDIQGLRAIAVIAVILDHLLHWPSGGFVGVDVFFVISGFLITGLLLREHDKTGTVSFKGFYLRRVRRIMPAAVTVLAVTACVSFLLFNGARAQQTVTDAAWSLFFSANWHFAAVGTDYFQASGPISPLQHFWSLAVEEQFYFVWPWLMLLIFFLGGRIAKWDNTRAHKAIAIAMSLIVAVSFAWALVDTMVSPTVAYFSTFSRAWELGIGALVAVFGSLFTRIPRAVRPVVAWIGIAGIVWSVFNVRTDMAFPAPWAAAPVLATALVIMAGTGGDQRFLWPLTNRGTSYVGDISYSLYLWHFPVIILLASLVMEDSPLYIPLAVVLMVGLAVAAYHLIEKRILDSIWLDYSYKANLVRRQRRHKGRKPVKLRTQLVALGVLTVAAVGVSAYALAAPRTATAVALPVPSADAVNGAPATVTALSARTASIQTALSTKDWPALTPDLDSLESKGRGIVSCQFGPKDALPSEADVDGKCLNGEKAASKLAVLVGDSYAAAISPGVIDALGPDGWKVIVLTKNSCPAISIAVKLEGGEAYPGCTDFQKFAAAQVGRLAPDMVILSSWNGQIVEHLASGASGAAALSEWKAAFQASTSSYSQMAAKVVAISPPPHGKNLQECATPLSHPSDCRSPVTDSFLSFVAAEQSAVGAVGKQSAKYVSMLDWFCTAGQCPPFIGANPVYVDGGHLTNTAAKAIAPLLKQALLS